MIKKFLLMLLVCGVCFSCHSPQQEKQQEDLTKANKNMTNEQLREKLVMALGDMKAKAIEVGDARDEVIRELKEMGIDTNRTIGVYPGSSWTIVDSEELLGVNLNIKPKR